jgi:hypothetical protein
MPMTEATVLQVRLHGQPIGTLTRLPGDRILFGRFAAKARLASKMTLDAVTETVSRFEAAWQEAPPDTIDEHIRAAIERHLETLPLWSELRSRGR